MSPLNLNTFKLDDFKRHISIAEFINFRSDLNFVIKKEGRYVKAYIPYKDSNGKFVYHNNKPVKERSIIISRVMSKHSVPYEYEMYWDMNAFNKDGGGSIVDFINEFVLRTRPGESIPFREVIGVMKQYMENSKFVPLEETSFDKFSGFGKQTSRQKKTDPKSIEYMIPTLTTFDYLKSRGIDSSVLSSSLFLGYYGSYKDRPAFLLSDINNKKQTLQWIDFDSKTNSHSGKYFLEGLDRRGAMYQSNFLPDTNTLCIIESPEKAMAHYQLFSADMKNQKVRPQYLSSCGSFTHHDAEFVKQRASSKNINRFILAFDNDLSGHNSTLHTFLELNGIDSNKASVHPSEKPGNFTFKFPAEAQHIFNQSLLNHPQQQKDKVFIMFDDKPERFFKLLETNMIRIHLSVTKDFLDDLNAGNKLPYRFKHDSSLSM